MNCSCVVKGGKNALYHFHYISLVIMQNYIFVSFNNKLRSFLPYRLLRNMYFSYVSYISPIKKKKACISHPVIYQSRI